MQQSLPQQAAPEHPVEQLAGSVERVTFHSEESGFCVLRVKVRGHRDLITVVGTAASITAGEYIECDGWWVTDRTHGLQFKTRHLHVVSPTTLEGIEKYLASGMVKGIGPHFLVSADVMPDNGSNNIDLNGGRISWLKRKMC